MFERCFCFVQDWLFVGIGLAFCEPVSDCVRCSNFVILSLPPVIDRVETSSIHPFIVDLTNSTSTPLQSALEHEDIQLRTDALSFLCEAKKTTESVSSQDFDAIRRFLIANMNFDVSGKEVKTCLCVCVCVYVFFIL